MYIAYAPCGMQKHHTLTVIGNFDSHEVSQLSYSVSDFHSTIGSR